MDDNPLAGVHALARIYEFGLLWHCIGAIAKLEVPDRLAVENMTLPDLAAAVGAREDPLWRVLRFLATHGLIALDGHHVGLTDFGRVLCKDHPYSMWSTFAAPGPADVAHALTYTLRTGNAAADKVFGAPFWDYLAEHPHEQETFDALMRRQAQILARSCIPDMEWPADGTIADIGGGLGTVLAAVLDKAPRARGVLVEQPQVLQSARAFLAGRDMLSRCELDARSLFAPQPEADMYLLVFIVHDWADDDAVKILSAVRRSARPSSVLRIFERLIEDDDSPHASKMFDVGVMLLTSGRERTAGEMKCLLGQAGWEIEQIVTRHDPINVIQARPVAP